MRTIYKYAIEGDSELAIPMPIGAKIRHVGASSEGKGYIWAEVDTEKACEIRTFKVYGTGWNINFNTYNKRLVYRGTFQVLELNEHFVWHVYEVVNND